MRAWLKGWFGPSRAELRDEAAMWQRRCEQRDVHVLGMSARVREMKRDLGAERARAHNLQQALAAARQRELLASEPPRALCVKVRLFTQEDARGWAEQVIANTAGQPGDLVAYRCSTCPRNPVTLQRYWHVGHRATDEGVQAKETAARAKGREQAQARKAGRTVGQQIDPEVAARLRAIR